MTSNCNVVAQDWPIGGHLTLVLSTPEPDPRAIAELGKVVLAIDCFRMVMVLAKHPLQSEASRGSDG